MAQEECPAEMVRKLFRNKANFRREPRLRRATYNGRAAFIRAKGLGDVAAQEAWRRLVNEWELRRDNVARELNVSAAESFIFDFYSSKR